MSNPVKIVVTAETVEAADKLKDFVRSAGSGLATLPPAASHAAGPLKELRETAMATHEGFRTLETSALLLGGERFPQLAMGVMGAAEGMKAMRSVAMLTGLTLAELAPPLVLIAAGVAAGAYVWDEYANAQAKADNETRKMVESLDKVAPLLEKINKLAKAGLLSPEAAQQMSNEATQRKSNPLYIGPDENVTTQATGEYEVPEYANTTFARVQSGSHTETRQNRKATQDEITKYELAKIDEISEKQADALAKFKEETQQAHDETMSGLEKEKAAIADKYEKQRQAILETAALAGASLTPDGVRNPKVDADAQAAIADLRIAQTNAIAAAEKKAADANARAAKERQDAWDRLNEKTTADLKRVEEMQDRANAKLLEDQKKQAEELDRQAALRREIADEEIKIKIADLQGREDMTPEQKAAAMEKLLGEESELLQVQINQLDVQKQATFDLTKQLEIQKKIDDLKIQKATLTTKEEKDDKSFDGQLGGQWDKLSNKTGNQNGDAASVLVSPFEGMRQGLDTAFTQMMEKGESFKQFMGTVALAIEKSFIQSVANMAADWITSQAMMLVKAVATQLGITTAHAAGTETRVGIHAAGEGQMTIFTVLGTIARQGWHLIETVWHGLMVAIRVAAHVAGEAACTAATEAGAAVRAIYHAIVAAIAAMESLASTPYVGVVLGIAAGAAMMAAAMGMMGGFAEGGQVTGPGSGKSDSIMARVSNGEFIVNADAVQKFGAANLHDINQGTYHASGGGASNAGNGASQAQHRTDNFIYFDSRQMMDHLERSDAHEKLIVDIMGRNIHKFRS